VNKDDDDDDDDETQPRFVLLEGWSQLSHLVQHPTRRTDWASPKSTPPW